MGLVKSAIFSKPIGPELIIGKDITTVIHLDLIGIKGKDCCQAHIGSYQDSHITL